MQENFRGGGGNGGSRGGGWSGGGRGWHHGGGGRYRGGLAYGGWDGGWDWGYPIYPYVTTVVSSCPTDYGLVNNFNYISNGVPNSVNNVCVSVDTKDSNQVCKSGGALVLTNASDKTYKCMVNPL